MSKLKGVFDVIEALGNSRAEHDSNPRQKKKPASVALFHHLLLSSPDKCLKKSDPRVRTTKSLMRFSGHWEVNRSNN